MKKSFKIGIAVFLGLGVIGWLGGGAEPTEKAVEKEPVKTEVIQEEEVKKEEVVVVETPAAVEEKPAETTPKNETNVEQEPVGQEDFVNAEIFKNQLKPASDDMVTIQKVEAAFWKSLQEAPYLVGSEDVNILADLIITSYNETIAKINAVETNGDPDLEKVKSLFLSAVTKGKESFALGYISIANGDENGVNQALALKDESNYLIQEATVALRKVNSK